MRRPAQLTRLPGRAGLGKPFSLFILHSAFRVLHLFPLPFIIHHSSFIISYKGPTMDSLESFVADLILKAVHKSAPTLTPADDAKVTKTVADFVTTGMDLIAVYFAIRNAKKS
jgi:hypothetical protein